MAAKKKAQTRVLNLNIDKIQEYAWDTESDAASRHRRDDKRATRPAHLAKNGHYCGKSNINLTRGMGQVKNIINKDHMALNQRQNVNKQLRYMAVANCRETIKH